MVARENRPDVVLPDPPVHSELMELERVIPRALGPTVEHAEVPVHVFWCRGCGYAEIDPEGAFTADGSFPPPREGFDGPRTDGGWGDE